MVTKWKLLRVTLQYLHKNVIKLCNKYHRLNVECYFTSCSPEQQLKNKLWHEIIPKNNNCMWCDFFLSDFSEKMGRPKGSKTKKQLYPNNIILPEKRLNDENQNPIQSQPPPKKFSWFRNSVTCFSGVSFGFLCLKALNFWIKLLIKSNGLPNFT